MASTEYFIFEMMWAEGTRSNSAGFRPQTVAFALRTTSESGLPQGGSAISLKRMINNY